MLQELARTIARHTTGLWTATPVPRLTVVSTDEPLRDIGMVYEPMVCFVAEGAKRTIAVDRDHLVGAGSMFLSTIDVPVTCTFAAVPYRSAVLHLDDRIVADLILETGGPAAADPAPGHALAHTTAGPELLDAVGRWVRLLDTPDDIGPLAARIESEIVYRLLTGPLGPMLRQSTVAGSHLMQVRAAAAHVRAHFAEPLTVQGIAAAAHMSVASLHRHFKAVTGMSPLQFQKRLRLQEARRLLLTGDRTAAITAAEVGYASATQFSREYRRTYGVPPARDAARLREEFGAAV